MLDPVIEVVRANALPINKVLEKIGGARLVLIGEASHGTHEFYRIRAELSLLIVGGADDIVIELNQEAARRMRAPVELKIIPGATHLFEEPGALEQVARLASEWCIRHLKKHS